MNPVPLENTEKFSFKIFLRIVGLSYILFFISSIFLIIFNFLNLLPDSRIPQINSKMAILIIVFIGPFFEEILFRLNLKISKLNIAAFISVLLIVTIKLINIGEVGNLVWFELIPILILVYFIIDRINFSVQKIDLFVKSNFKYVFYFFAFAFGIMHLTNFKIIYLWMIITSPLLTAPYITSGCILGYVRMKYGFVPALLIHLVVNSIYVLVAIPKHFIY